MDVGLLIGRPGTTEILLIVGAIVLLFGASKIPELARNIGRAKGEFKRGIEEGEQELEEDEDEEARQAEAAADPNSV